MIKLGDLLLPPDMLLEGEFDQQYVLASSETTIDGSEVLFCQPKNSGESFDLVAGEDFGWLTRQMVDALREMARTFDVFTLLYHGEIKEVRFRHEDPPVLSLSPLNPIVDSTEGVFYIGRIKLREV